MIVPGARRAIRFPRHSFRPASVTLERIGQLSPDGSKYWDSQHWVSAFSRDGSWRWNGKTWVPADPPEHPPLPAEIQARAAAPRGFLQAVPGFRSGARAKIAIVVLVLVVLMTVGAIQLAMHRIGTQQPVASPSASPASVALRSKQLQLAVASPSPEVATHPSPASRRPAASPSPSPTPTPSPTPPPTCGAPPNPFGYDFCPPAALIYHPPPTFCDYFTCIASFWTNIKGYIEECVDGTYSHTGGHAGDCTGHGGDRRPLSQ
jgi:hypothetical protein